MPTLPAGTLTFLFTDIEGSTALWERHKSEMRAALQRHDEILNTVIDDAGGHVFKTVGDAFCAAFASASSAARAALGIQQAFANQPCGDVAIRVRVALHTGEAEQRGGDYFGQPLNRVARILSAAHGGQVLLSRVTYELVRDALPGGTVVRSLGEHRLRDLQRPEEIMQISADGLRTDFPPVRVLDAFSNNLPIQLTSFVGRESELAEVRTLLRSTRLLTLAGAGGTGKTRLALQAAADLIEDFADGAWVVELALVTDAERVPEATAQALGLEANPSRPVLDSLKEFMRDRRMLFVLDNCEHVLAASAFLVDALLRSGPALRIIATSREPLGIAGETTMRMPSLSLPGGSDGPPTAASLAHSEAARLFVERAVAAEPHFVVTDGNAPAIAQVCERLDGMPLAIELAAARVKVLAVDQIAARLDDRFRLLTGGSRTALPRQQTLRAAIDWSYQLLTERERTMLRRLSVFVGGWDLEAAEAVCATSEIYGVEVLDLMGRLVDRSLVVVDQGERVRYRLLETVRQYAREKLVDAGEVKSARDAHLDWAVRFAEKAGAGFRSRDYLAWSRRLRHESENLRAAIEWARAEPDPPTRFIRLVCALGDYWVGEGQLAEGEELAAEAARRSGDLDIGRAVALTWSGMLANSRGMRDRATEALEAGLALARRLGDAKCTMIALQELAGVAMSAGKTGLAREQLAEALRISRDECAADPTAPFWEARALLGFAAVADAEDMPAEAEAWGRRVLELCRHHGLSDIALVNLGEFARARGDWADAESFYAEALESSRNQRLRGAQAVPLLNLAYVSRHFGDWRTAASRVAEAMRLFRERGSSGWTLCLGALAGIALLANRVEDGARLLGAGAAHEWIPLDTADALERTRDRDQLTAVLGEDSFNRAFAEGQAMTKDGALSFAQGVIRDLLA